MGTKQKIPYYVNLGGLNLRTNDPLLQGNEAQVADNVIFKTWGEISQRDGFAAQIAAPATGDKIRVIHQHVERASNVKTRLLVRGSRITKLVDDTETVLDSSLTSSTLLGASAQLFDDSVICTGADEPQNHPYEDLVLRFKNNLEMRAFEEDEIESFINDDVNY